MGHVSVTINGRKYQIACDDGQEAHLARLAASVDQRIAELVAAVGQVGDARLLVMASLLVADELSDVYSRLEAAQGAAAGVEALAARQQAEEELAETIETLARRIEHIAERLEHA